MIDAVALPSHIDDCIDEVLRDEVLQNDAASQRLPPTAHDSLKLLHETAAKVVGERPRSPAEEAVIECVRTGLERGRDAGFQAEWNHFGPLLLSRESRNLRRLFFYRERARKPSTWIADTKAPYDASRPLAIAGVAIEAVVEHIEVKRDIFQRLDKLLAADALIVSNTSALPISWMAEGTSRGETSAGLLFCNPVHGIALVEIVRTPRTCKATLARLIDLARRLGKVPIVVQDSPGFVVTRTLFLYLDEAVRLACEGHAIELIDAEAKQFGLPMGPLELLDLVGLDAAAEILQALTPLVNESSPAVSKLEAMIAAGRLGKKSKSGFYNYSAETYRQLSPNATAGMQPHLTMNPRELAVNGPAELSEISQRLILRLLLEAARCFHERIVAEEWMVDLAMSLGTGYPTWRCGPLQTILDWGPKNVVAALFRLSQDYGPRFTPPEGVFELSNAM